MNKNRSKKGYTLAEVLAVVGIIAVLAAVSFVGVLSYLRSMTKLQYDGYAKEIFVAAQNHLTMAESQKYLGRTDFGTQETAISGVSDSGSGVYAFVVTDDYRAVTSAASVLNLMLPTGSVDGTVRLGGSCLVRYHKDSGQMLDVFYWSQKGERFSHTYTPGDYANFLRNRENRDALENYGTDHSVIGYYGGVTAESLERGEPLEAPTLVVRNADTLTATVTDPNGDIENARLKLVITGLTSGVTREIDLTGSGVPVYVEQDLMRRQYKVALDDITASGMHFTQLFCTGANGMIPGEDVQIQAVAYNNTQLTNVAGSAVQTTNSLFATGTQVAQGTAWIANIRHLENLAPSVSNVNSILSSVKYSAARQTTDLSWKDFFGGEAAIAQRNGESTKAGTFLPVSPTVPLAYQGEGHTVSDIVVDHGGSAGLFGELTAGSVEDLKLVDFTITGQAGAGALAGTAMRTVVRNVLAVNTTDDAAQTIRGGAGVGGLLGALYEGSVENSAAALVVGSSAGNAGGLIGTVSGSSAITGCYAGGHTKNGQYQADAYNITAAGAAGGLLGDGDSAVVRNSYSTCSVTGATAGGLAGTAGGSLTGCYATGLVGGSLRGAFAGSLTGSASDCRYFQTVNETPSADGTTQLAPVGSGSAGGVTALDATAASYNAFIGAQRDPAVAYDAVLDLYYHGKYELRTVAQLGASVSTGDWVATHYGDWPAPELWVINTAG